MGRYSGKCDLEDHLWMSCTEEEINKRIQNSKYYVGDIRIKADCIKDLVPYYPFIISSGGHSKESECLYLSTESYVDRREREILLWRKKDMVRELNRAKRKKLQVNEDMLINACCTYDNDEEYTWTLAKRVLEFGDKAEYRDLHIPLYDKLYREPLYEEMIKCGYDEKFARHWIYERNRPWYTEGKMKKEW